MNDYIYQRNGMKKHCFSLFFVMKKNEKQCFINLITRRSSVQIWLPQPNLNGTIDTKVVPFFYTHKMPKIRTFCYEKKHLKNGFPFLWRAENKQRNEWVRATKRMSKGCIFLLWLHFFRFAVSLVKKAFLYRKKSADRNIPDSRLFNLYALNLDFWTIFKSKDHFAICADGYLINCSEPKCFGKFGDQIFLWF